MNLGFGFGFLDFLFLEFGFGFHEFGFPDFGFGFLGFGFLGFGFGFLEFGFGFLPGAADHAGNLRHEYALTGSMFSFRVEIVKFILSDDSGTQESEGVPDSESVREMLSRASLIFGFGWFLDHFGFGVNSPVFSNPIPVAGKVSGSHCTTLLVGIRANTYGSQSGLVRAGTVEVDLGRFCGDSHGRSVVVRPECAAAPPPQGLGGPEPQDSEISDL